MADDKKKPAAGGPEQQEDRPVIRIDTPEYDPTLDPESPEFDAEKWAELMERKKEIGKQLKESLDKTIADMGTPIFKAFSSGEIPTAIKDAMTDAVKPVSQAVETPGVSAAALERIKAAANEMRDTLNQIVAPSFKAAQAYFKSDEWKTIRDAVAKIAEIAPLWLKLGDEIEELTPYIEAELQKPEYEGKTISELFNTAETDEDGNPIESSLLLKALHAAQAARDADTAKKEPIHTTAKRTKTVEFPLDKPNSILWSLLEKDTKGQVTFNMAKFGSKQNIPAYYAIDFDALGDDITITKRLLPFDKRVYIAVSALFNAGNNVISLSQIYYAMGYTGRPGTKDLSRINDAITKMMTAHIFFNNEQEAEKYKYPKFVYDGSLLPLERGTAIVNGQLADAAIHIFREPPLITFAKQRKQITTVDVKLLQSPVSKTDANLQIDDYLIERISKARNGKGKSCRILFKTLYDHTGIPDKPKTNTEKQQKKRAPDKIKKYLTHYQQQGFISRFTMEADGITIHW